jgi:hypothetical protein
MNAGLVYFWKEPLQKELDCQNKKTLHGRKGNSTEFLSHHYFLSLVLGLGFPCGKGRSDIAKKKSRFPFSQ